MSKPLSQRERRTLKRGTIKLADKYNRMSDGIVPELGSSSMIREASVTFLMEKTKQNRDTAIGQLVQWEEGKGDIPSDIADVLTALNAVNDLMRKSLEVK